MSHTIKQAIIAVVIAAAVYLLSGPIIGYTNYDMYLRAIEFLAAVIAGGCYWIGSNERK
jgi:hypothetical protein